MNILYQFSVQGASKASCSPIQNIKLYFFIENLDPTLFWNVNCVYVSMEIDICKAYLHIFNQVLSGFS